MKNNSEEAPIIEVTNLAKSYTLGEFGSGTLYEDIQAYFNAANAKLRAKQAETKSQDDKLFWALKDVNFSVNKGEVLGVIGRNGAGKSTLLKLLSQITSPTSGEIKLNGRVASLLEVGTGFHPDLTGRENVFLNGAIMGMTKQEIHEQFDEIVEFSGCAQHIDTPIKRYSSGMAVRLGFSIAAHLQPEILIVDEVLAVGDFEFQNKCINKMKDVSSFGRTVIFVSHNMQSILSLCDRVILIDKGKVVADGETKLVVNEYLSHQINDEDEEESRSSTGAAILGVDIKTDDRDEFYNFKYSEDILITINYRLDNPDFRGGFNILLRDVENNVIFTSWDSDSAIVGRDFHESSRAQCVIPGELLKPGIYHLVVVLQHRQAGHVTTVSDQSYQLSVKDSENLFSTKRSGMIRPRLDWTFE